MTSTELPWYLRGGLPAPPQSTQTFAWSPAPSTIYGAVCNMGSTPFIMPSARSLPQSPIPPPALPQP